MDCCKTQMEARPRGGWWRGASGCAGSGLMLVLLPKCPMCLAAYLAVWTGASVAARAAALARPLLLMALAASVLMVLIVGVSAWRVRGR